MFMRGDVVRRRVGEHDGRLLLHDQALACRPCVFHRVHALSQHFPRGTRRFTRLGQRDRWVGTQPHVATFPLDLKAHDPTARTVLGDIQGQARDATDEVNTPTLDAGHGQRAHFLCLHSCSLQTPLTALT